LIRSRVDVIRMNAYASSTPAFGGSTSLTTLSSTLRLRPEGSLSKGGIFNLMPWDDADPSGITSHEEREEFFVDGDSYLDKKMSIIFGGIK
jgi:hypothetical protein